jgi:hypothetical protein
MTEDVIAAALLALAMIPLWIFLLSWVSLRYVDRWEERKESEEVRSGREKRVQLVREIDALRRLREGKIFSDDQRAIDAQIVKLIHTLDQETEKEIRHARDQGIRPSRDE